MKNQTLLKKFSFAWQGIVYAIKAEANMRRHLWLGAAVLVLFAGLQPAAVWWALIVLCIGLILAAELANSALEALIDYLHPDIHPQIGHVKDMLAGMVLVLSITAGIIGMLAVLSTQGL